MEKLSINYIKGHSSYNDIELYILLINCLQQDRYEESKKKWCRLNLNEEEALIIKKYPNLFCMQTPKENSTFKVNACITKVTVDEFEKLIIKMLPIKSSLEQAIKKLNSQQNLKAA